MKAILISLFFIGLSAGAIAEESSQPVKRLSNIIELVNKDPITDIETYRSNQYIAGKVAPLYLVYNTKKNSKPLFFMILNYSGTDWIFMNKVNIRCNDSVFEFKLPTALVDRQAYGGSVVERAVLPYTGMAVKAAECLANKPEKKVIQFTGKYTHSDELPDYVSRAMNDMIYVQKNWKELSASNN